MLDVGNCCYVAIYSAAQGASAPTRGGEGRGHIVAAACPPAYSLLTLLSASEESDCWLVFVHRGAIFRIFTVKLQLSDKTIIYQYSDFV